MGGTIKLLLHFRGFFHSGKPWLDWLKEPRGCLPSRCDCRWESSTVFIDHSLLSRPHHSLVSCPSSGSFEAIGPRDSMEDRTLILVEEWGREALGRTDVSLFGVFDGHR